MTSRLSTTDRAILGLAIPALGALAIDPLLTLADTAFVARLGTVELAALGVDTALLGFAFFAFNFLAYVTTPLVARSIGRGKVDEARRWVGDAMLLALVLGVLVAIAIELTTPLLVDLMGATGDVASEAVSYLRIRALATPAVLIVMAGHGAFRGYKDTRTPLIVAAGVNGLNVVLDPLLIFTLGLGLDGAALATVIAQYVGAVWFLRLVRSRSMATRPRGLAESLPSLKELGRNGALLTVRSGFLLATFTVAASAATRISAEAIAAHQLVAQMFLLSAMLADAFAIAAQAMVGETAGQGETQRLHALVKRLTWWGLGAGALLAILMAFGRFPLALLATSETVSSLTIDAGGIAALFQPVNALVFVADGIFLGLLALAPMVWSSGTGAAAAIGIILLTTAGGSLDGIWWAMGALVVARGIVFVFTYRGSAEMALRS